MVWDRSGSFVNHRGASGSGGVFSSAVAAGAAPGG